MEEMKSELDEVVHLYKKSLKEYDGINKTWYKDFLYKTILLMVLCDIKDELTELNKKMEPSTQNGSTETTI